MDPLLEKDVRRNEKQPPCAFFWTIWKERNRNSFDNEEQLDHPLKISFPSNLFLWVKLFVDFVDWLGSQQGREVVFCILHFRTCLLVPIVYIMCTLG